MVSLKEHEGGEPLVMTDPRDSRGPLASRIATLALAAAIVAATAGCARAPIVGKLLAKWKTAQPEQPIEFRIAFPQAGEQGPGLLDRLTARPGDPVYVDVAIRNLTRKSLTLQFPHVSSIAFYFKSAASPSPIQVRPVFSSKDTDRPPLQLAPGQTKYHRFVFTLLTKEPGEHLLQAWYYPTPRGMASGLAPAISKPISLQVAGPRFCNRDRDGILVKEHAVILAKRTLGRPVTDAVAYLLPDEYGFLIWWVTLTIDPNELKPGEEPYQAYFICPYRAVVKSSQVQPYIPNKQEEPPKPPPFQTPPSARQ